jgi:hypothetical protein
MELFYNFHAFIQNRKKKLIEKRRVVKSITSSIDKVLIKYVIMPVNVEREILNETK